MASKAHERDSSPHSVRVETTADNAAAVRLTPLPDGSLKITISSGLREKAARAAGRIPLPSLEENG